MASPSPPWHSQAISSIQRAPLPAPGSTTTLLLPLLAAFGALGFKGHLTFLFEASCSHSRQFYCRVAVCQRRAIACTHGTARAAGGVWWVGGSLHMRMSTRAVQASKKHVKTEVIEGEGKSRKKVWDRQRTNVIYHWRLGGRREPAEINMRLRNSHAQERPPPMLLPHLGQTHPVPTTTSVLAAGMCIRTRR